MEPLLSKTDDFIQHNDTQKKYFEIIKPTEQANKSSKAIDREEQG